MNVIIDQPGGYFKLDQGSERYISLERPGPVTLPTRLFCSEEACTQNPAAVARIKFQ
jgi:hypothetical protein